MEGMVSSGFTKLTGIKSLEYLTTCRFDSSTNYIFNSAVTYVTYTAVFEGPSAMTNLNYRR
jgi:hypothetical protein